jgi:hypothetical protein
MRHSRLQYPQQKTDRLGEDLIIWVEYEKYDCCRRWLLLVLDVPVILTLLGRSIAPELSFRVVRRDVAIRCMPHTWQGLALPGFGHLAVLIGGSQRVSVVGDAIPAYLVSQVCLIRRNTLILMEDTISFPVFGKLLPSLETALTLAMLSGPPPSPMSRAA